MLCLLSLVQGTSPASLTCPGGGSPQTYYANYEYNEYYPVITQNPTTPLSITLGSTQPNADAFWLHNDDGDLIGFQNVAGSATFDLTPYQPEAITAFVHYSSPECIIAASNVTYTVQGQIAEYYRSAEADVCCNVPFSSWSAADRLAATPVWTNVDYDARTATVTVAVSPAKPVPFVYIRAADQRLLGYGVPDQTRTYTYSLTISNIDQYETTISGCAPLDGRQTCTDVSLTSEITTALVAATPAAGSSSRPRAILASASALRLRTPISGCGANYCIWATDSNGDIAGFSHNAPLTVTVGLANCDYASEAGCTLSVGMLCNGAIHTTSLDVSTLAGALTSAYSGATWTAPEDTAACAGQTGDASWTDETTGHLCECFNGVAECGPRQYTYFSGVEWLIVAIVIVVVALVGVVVLVYLVKTKKAMGVTNVKGKEEKKGDEEAGKGVEMQSQSTEVSQAAPPPPEQEPSQPDKV